MNDNVVSLIHDAEPATPTTGPAPGITAFNPCGHVANAQRLVQHFGDKLLYVPGIGWHVLGPPWKHDDLAAAKLVHGLGKLVSAEAAGMGSWVADAPSKERKEREEAMQARFKWADRCETQQVINDTLAAARPYFVAKADELDADPDLLGCPSGVLNLRTAEWREHDPADRITKVAGCDFNAEAEAPTWERFVSDVFGGDEELIGWFQRFAGYTLHGNRKEHLLPIFWGGGGNGKSTALGTLQAMFGDYAGTAAPGLLIAKHGSEHPTGIADLQGRRFVVASETGETGKLAEDQVKMLTGGDRITARRMRQDFYQFDPTHQLVMQTNHKPRVNGTDDGIWRRIRLIPFNVKFSGADRDPDLPAKLRGELQGILTWCWAGWRWYLADGLDNAPEAVTAATAEYREASDAIGGFIADCCTVNEFMTARASELYREYCHWCESNGEFTTSQRVFGTRLGERGFVRAKSDGVIQWRGLRIN